MIKNLLVVDDSALMRRVLSDIIETDKRFLLADSANNGLEAYDLVVTNPRKYDLIILDINMPKMNGIQFMEKLNEKGISVPILIVSTIAKEGASETLKCLELGAFDFITKPDSFMETKGDKFRNKLISFMCGALHISVTPAPEPKNDIPQPLIYDEIALSRPAISVPDKTDKPLKYEKNEQFEAHFKPEVKPVREALPKAEEVSTSETSQKGLAADGPMSYNKVEGIKRLPHKPVPAGGNKLVAFACSTGGPKALQSVIPKLPANLAAPVILVQHMPEGFTESLAQRLNDMSQIKVKEACNGDILQRGTVYIARGGNHLRIAKNGRNYEVVLGDDLARNGLRPCADIMYESLCNLDFEEITCVVLTGMGSDGTRGIGQLSMKKNVYVIAQDEASSTVYGMPRMVKEAGVTDEVVTLGSIADAITRIVGTC